MWGYVAHLLCTFPLTDVNIIVDSGHFSPMASHQRPIHISEDEQDKLKQLVHSLKESGEAPFRVSTQHWVHVLSYGDIGI
jgi:hypothetical protein